MRREVQPLVQRNRRNPIYIQKYDGRKDTDSEPCYDKLIDAEETRIEEDDHKF